LKAVGYDVPDSLPDNLVALMEMIKNQIAEGLSKISSDELHRA